MTTKTKHRQSKTRLYRIWVSMISRCKYPSHNRWKYYGGKGIEVCKEWQKFEAFYLWAKENGYADNLTIDRIDSDGNYEPLNCRWVTYEIQNNHLKRNHFITYKEETHTMAEWAKIKDIPYQTLAKRINELGWSIERAFNEKPMLGKNRHKIQ